MTEHDIEVLKKLFGDYIVDEKTMWERNGEEWANLKKTLEEIIKCDTELQL